MSKMKPASWMLIVTAFMQLHCAGQGQAPEQGGSQVPSQQSATGENPGKTVELDEVPVAPFSKYAPLVVADAGNASQDAAQLRALQQLQLQGSTMDLQIALNGNASQASVLETTEVVIGIKLDPKQTQFYGEFFVLFASDDGQIYHYCNNGWCPGIASSYQGGLFTMSKRIGFTQNLKKGGYTAYFIIDKMVNDRIDADQATVSVTRLLVD